MERASKKTKEVVYKESDFEAFLFGWVLGKVKADPLSSQRFPNWMPIPWYLGVTSTSALVLISLAFLSPAFLFKQFGLSMPGGGLNTDLSWGRCLEVRLLRGFILMPLGGPQSYQRDEK